MKRKLISLVLLVVMVLGQTPVCAAENNPNYDVMPAYVHVAMMMGTLTIGDDGEATCGAYVTLDNGYKVKVTMELLKFNNGSWTSLKSWTASGSGARGVDLVQSYRVSQSDMYKVKVTAYVTDSNDRYVESPVCYSVTQEYTK